MTTASEATSPQRRALLQSLALAPWLGALPTLARATAPPRSDGSRQAVAPFALAQVRLLPGAFQQAQRLDGRYLSACERYVYP